MIGGILHSAISGVSVNAQRIAAAADNIANVSTVGYKPTEIQAQTLATRQVSLTSYSAGGVSAAPRAQAGVQGLLAASTSPTDMAISGNGYFAVSRTPQSSVAQDQALYTRNGSFAPDAQGYLVNSAGHYLLAAPTGGGDLSAVNVNRIGVTAHASTKIAVGVNLPPTANVGETFTVSAPVTDSLGNAHALPIAFTRQGPGAYQMSISGAELGAEGGGAYAINAIFGGDGLIRGFDTNGDGAPDQMSPPDVHVAYAGGANPVTARLDLGSSTQLGGDFVLNAVRSDGAGPGSVQSLSVSGQGALTATFSNGQVRTVAQIPVATFVSPQNLEPVGANTFRPTDASGAPLFDGAGAGQVQGGALELSATNMAQDFVTMIVAQTAYGASLKVLSAGEDMARTLMNVRA